MLHLCVHALLFFVCLFVFLRGQAKKIYDKIQQGLVDVCNEQNGIKVGINSDTFGGRGASDGRGLFSYTREEREKRAKEQSRLETFRRFQRYGTDMRSQAAVAQGDHLVVLTKLLQRDADN